MYKLAKKLDLTNTDTMINLKLHDDLMQTTQAAAKACYSWIGMGNEKKADQAAVNAMRDKLNSLNISGRVAIGEGERDEAPMLYIGEKVGLGGFQIDLALDPLEGTTLCAHNAPNSISVIAATESGKILHAPDIYMEKIAVGSNLPRDAVHIDNHPKINLSNLAKAKRCSISDLTVCMLNRPRHEELIAKVREAGARIKLIKDGDVMTALATAMPNSGIDMYIGIGGAPEGVIAAAALKVLGGQIQGRLVFKDDLEKARAKAMGINDTSFIYDISTMISGNAIFVATGITDGDYLKGVRHKNNKFYYNSLVISSITSTLSYHEVSEL